jgi:hypothetical protein
MSKSIKPERGEALDTLIKFLLIGTSAVCASLVGMGNYAGALKCAAVSALCALILAAASVLISKLG